MQLSRLLTILCLSLFTLSTLQAQDPNLAAQYFANGEYEKSATLYGQLSENDPQNEYYFNRQVESLLKLEQFDGCEKAIKKQLKKNPGNILTYVTYGILFDRQGKDQEAMEQYQKALDKLDPDYTTTLRLAYAFEKASKFDLAIESYQKGGQLLKSSKQFAFNLGELYRKKGDTEKMIGYYLDALQDDPGRFSSIQTTIARFLPPQEYSTLQAALYARLQASDYPEFIDLLAWSFVQRKDYKSALRQFKSLDKRLGESGQRVFKLAEDAELASDYDAAIAGYEYIIAEKGPMNPYFFDAKQAVMHCRRKKITEGYDYTPAELLTLETEYEQFLALYGRSRQSANLISQQAELEALYINNLPKAIALLEEVKSLPGLDRVLLAQTKIKLADYYLMSGEIWESTLLYSQVDKDFKEEQIGQEARYKNARLSYFNGNFQWAQAQFDVLKASTSKLISNDAIDLSVFIMDNLNLDTTASAITLYAQAEQLTFQNLFDEAFKKLDTLKNQFPDHALQDDILFLEGQILEKKRNFNDAANRYQQIVEQYKEDIRADNALYAWARLCEFRLKDTEKAKNLYEKLFIDYSGSVFAVDARKRFRLLRGDKTQ